MSMEIALQLLLSVTGVLLLVIGGWIGSNIKELTKSVNALTIKLAIVVEQVGTHEKRIQALEKRRY